MEAETLPRTSPRYDERLGGVMLSYWDERIVTRQVRCDACVRCRGGVACGAQRRQPQIGGSVSATPPPDPRPRSLQVQVLELMPYIRAVVTANALVFRPRVGTLLGMLGHFPGPIRRLRARENNQPLSAPPNRPLAGFSPCLVTSVCARLL